MKEKIVFDPASAADTDNVGAYNRSGSSGALITNHAQQKPSAGSFVFVDADVTPASDQITESSHGFQTGDKAQLTSSGVLPAGLALLTDYFVIRVDANTIKLAASITNAEAGIAVDITAAAGGGNHTLTGQEQEIRALDVYIVNDLPITTKFEYAEDSAHASAATGAFILAVRHDADTSMVDADGDYAPLQVDENGNLKVIADLDVNFDYVYAEDTAHASADLGAYILSVRQDVLAASTDTDGDYQSFKTDDVGSLWVHMSEAVPANVDNQLDNAALSIGTSQVLVTAALASRRKLILQNVDPAKPIFVGATGVTISDGLRLSPGSVLEIELDAGASLYAIAGFPSILARVLETGYA